MAKVKERAYVVNTACVGCSRGSGTTNLQAPSRVKIGTNWVVTAKDTGAGTFASNFGTCRRTGKACTLSTLPAWHKPAEKVLVGTWNPEMLAYENKVAKIINDTQSLIRKYNLLPQSSKNAVSVKVLQICERQVQKTRGIKNVNLRNKNAGDIIALVRDHRLALLNMRRVSLLHKHSGVENSMNSTDIQSVSKKLSSLQKRIPKYLSARAEFETGVPVITTDSRLVCYNGGVIAPVDSGQTKYYSKYFLSIGTTVDNYFLPGTALENGAIGPTTGILKKRMVQLYEENFISKNAAQMYGSGIAGEHIIPNWSAIQEYIDKGISYKTKSEDRALKLKARRGDYRVTRSVWESLDLPIGKTWEDMFGTINTFGKTIRMKLLGNTATLIWHPRFEVLLENASGKFDKISPRYIYPADAKYEDTVKECLDGVLRWESAHPNNGNPTIQGVSGEFKVEIRDYHNRLYDPSEPISEYYFHTPKGSSDKTNVEIKLGSKYAAMVPTSLVWSNTNKLKVNIKYPSSSTNIDRLMEHEFGHVAGLFDAYGYEDKDDTAHYNYGGHGIQGIVLPPAYIDGKDIKWNSVMVDYAGTPDPAGNPNPNYFTRTSLDYEMLLFAWRDNTIQNYVDNILGIKSQAFYH